MERLTYSEGIWYGSDEHDKKSYLALIFKVKPGCGIGHSIKGRVNWKLGSFELDVWGSKTGFEDDKMIGPKEMLKWDD